MRIETKVESFIAEFEILSFFVKKKKEIFRDSYIYYFGFVVQALELAELAEFYLGLYIL